MPDARIEVRQLGADASTCPMRHSWASRNGTVSIVEVLVALLGSAAIAMWWDIAPAQRVEFEDWHTHEHFPERLSIPGFLRGSRWSSANEGFFVMYELETYDTLTSTHYLERLNNPTPWSTKMMPHHRNMVRSQCRVIDSYGGGIAGSLLTTRMSPEASQAGSTRRALLEILRQVPHQIGLTSAHLLRTETPQLAQTTEQKIRGGKDAVVDWIVIVSGYDARALEDLVSAELALSDVSSVQHDVYRLSYAATPRDLELNRALQHQ
jgi:hypothetical protein